MIYYDSHKWRTLAKIRGSVLPKAMMWAAPSALFAYVLKWQELEGNLTLKDLDVLTQGDIYSGFTFVLGFSLVFRTSQSYLRYWTAATSIHEMGSEWSDSCASLIAFTTISKFPQCDVDRFRHTVIRLFSLLHAMALEEIASVDGEFPLLGIEGMDKQRLLLLTSGLAQGRKVQVVLSWIKGYITQAAESGLLNTPAPILTRVFQELGAGLVNYHKAQQIVIWPFPFPYTQLNLLLIQVYCLLTPLVVSTWKSWPWMCCVFTFISVTCMIGLDLIASELENPFGDDPNDLPVLDMQSDMNKILTLQLNPAIHRAPELLPSAVMSYRELAVQCQTNLARTSLQQRLKRGFSTPSVKATMSSGCRSDRLHAQLRWCGQVSVESEVKRLQNWLKCLPSTTQRNITEAVERENETETSGYTGCSHRMPPSSERKFQEEQEAPAPSPWASMAHSFASEQSEESTLPMQRKAQDATYNFPPVVRPASLPPAPAASSSSAPASVEPGSNRKHFASCASDCSSHWSQKRCPPESFTMETVQEQVAHLQSEPPLQDRSFSSIHTVSSHQRGHVAGEEPPWNLFLNALHNELRAHLDCQLDVQRKELRELEGVLMRHAQALTPTKRQGGCTPQSARGEPPGEEVGGAAAGRGSGSCGGNGGGLGFGSLTCGDEAAEDEQSKRLRLSPSAGQDMEEAAPPHRLTKLPSMKLGVGRPGRQGGEEPPGRVCAGRIARCPGHEERRVVL